MNSENFLQRSSVVKVVSNLAMRSRKTPLTIDMIMSQPLTGRGRLEVWSRKADIENVRKHAVLTCNNCNKETTLVDTVTSTVRVCPHCGSNKTTFRAVKFFKDKNGTTFCEGQIVTLDAPALSIFGMKAVFHSSFARLARDFSKDEAQTLNSTEFVKDGVLNNLFHVVV